MKAKNGQGELVDMTVLDALRLKHPDPGLASAAACTTYPTLPDLIDLDITGGHIQTVARRLRGSAGSGGSDAEAWQDCLLRFGAHSERLRDSVAHAPCSSDCKLQSSGSSAAHLWPTG